MCLDHTLTFPPSIQLTHHMRHIVCVCSINSIQLTHHLHHIVCVCSIGMIHTAGLISLSFK